MPHGHDPRSVPPQIAALRALVLLTATLVILSSCAVPPLPARVLYESPTDFVRLEPDPEVYHELPRTLHGHPADVREEDMAAVLKALFVQEHRNALQRYFAGIAPLEPAFHDEEIAWLAPRLTEALAAAQPDEWVTFYLSYPQTSLKREITSGSLYVQQGLLHFRLANHRIVYGIPAYGLVYDRRYPASPTAPKAFDLHLDPPAAVVHQKTSWWKFFTGRAKDELIIDLSKVSSLQLAT